MASKGVVNINTASQEELRSIRDIGEQRAKIILNARAEKGKLTLEDLKTLQGLPSTIWDPLVAAGKIIFENPVEEDPVEKIQEEMDKIRKDLETKLFILEQDKQQHNMNTKIKLKPGGANAKEGRRVANLCYPVSRTKGPIRDRIT